MMIKLRESTAIIMWIVIVAFVGLIVVEWGADFSGTSSAGSSDAIGVINGREVSLKHFQEAVRAAAQRSARDSDTRDDGALVRQVWDDLVGDLLVRQELERVGIEISDDELAYYTRISPPEAVQSIPEFQTDGEFDIQKYNEFLRDPGTYANATNKNFVMWIERSLANQLLNYRLRKLFMETARVSPAEVRQHYIDESQKLTVEYVFSPASAIAEDAVSIDESQLQSHYEELASGFRHPDQIKVALALFRRQPSGEDSAAVEKDIRQLREEIVAGSDFEELARIMSEDAATAAEGGDLGTFGRGRMVKAFEDVAFALELGQVSEPVMTQFGWHLIRVEAEVEGEGDEGEQRQARHILLKIRPSPATEDRQFETAQEFRELAVEMGIETAVAVKGVETRIPDWVNRSAGAVIPGLDQGSAWLVNFFMESDIGTLSQVGSTQQYYYVAQLLDRRPEGVFSLGDVRQGVERSLMARKRAEAAGETLQQVRSQVQAGAGMEKAASDAGLGLRSTDPFARGDFVPDVGRNNTFVGTAVKLEPGEMSDIITDMRGAYLLRLVDRSAVDEEDFLERRSVIEQELLQQKQMEALQAFLTRMYDSAQIEDNRHRFYTF